MADAPLTVTPEQLLTAWQQRRRPGWPDTFAACMADPMLTRLVRAYAMGMAKAASSRARRTEVPAAPPPTAAPAPAHRATARTPARPAQAALFDRKRLAAGDTDDD